MSVDRGAISLISMVCEKEMADDVDDEEHCESTELIELERFAFRRCGSCVLLLALALLDRNNLRILILLRVLLFTDC